LAFENNLKINEISFFTIWDNYYPKLLLHLNDAPLVLYYKGNLEILKSKQMITVVGARNTNRYTEIIMEKILAPSCQLGIGVVSGLAFGVDALAHQIAVKNKAPTIGVIGSGLDQKSFYPMENWALSKQIVADGGLILSEYAPNTPCTKYTFPQRNRILASLTDLTWVVQAKIGSGSLITAMRAREIGKTIATTPANILEECSGGNLKLLKEGASIISETQDIVDLLGLKLYPEIKAKAVIEYASPEEEKIHKLLSLEPISTELLAQKSEIEDLAMHLTMLELSGLALNIGENKWVRA
jgi:DNA processing protein